MAIDFPNSPTLNQIFTDSGKTWTYDGEKWVSTNLASLVGAKAYRSSNLSRANNSFVNLSFNAQEYDTHAFFAPTSTDMTIPSGLDGYYLVQGSIEFAANATGLREAGIQRAFAN